MLTGRQAKTWKEEARVCESGEWVVLFRLVVLLGIVLSDLLEILSMGIKGWESLFQQDFLCMRLVV